MLVLVDVVRVVSAGPGVVVHAVVAGGSYPSDARGAAGRTEDGSYDGFVVGRGFLNSLGASVREPRGLGACRGLRFLTELAKGKTASAFF